MDIRLVKIEHHRHPSSGHRELTVEHFDPKNTFVGDEFPVFKKIYTETRTQSLERWGREHKDLAANRDCFVAHKAASAFYASIASMPLADALSRRIMVEDLCELFKGFAYKGHIGRFVVQCDDALNSPEAIANGELAVFIEYTYESGLGLYPRVLILRNVQ